MNVTRTFDLLDYALEKFPRKDCLAAKVDGQWNQISTEEFKKNATYLAYGLLALGVKKGDKIATVSNNRPEWNYIDMAIAMTGAVHVPVYPTISSKDYDFMLNHCEAKFAFISDAVAWRRVSQVVNNIPSLQKVYSFNQIDGVENWNTVLELGKKSEVYYKEELEKAKKDVKEDDLCSIIYTSGTTGLSKGAMLTHKNFCSNFQGACNILGLNHTHKVLSILPLCHVYERCFNYMYQYLGIGIYYAQNLGTIVKDLCEIKANGCNTVPRVAEKIVEGIMKEGAKFTGMKKKLFNKAVELGQRFEHNNANGFFYNIERMILDKLVYKHWREDFFGGEMKFFGCGGAAISPNLSRMLWCAGIKVCEGYGLTETSPIIAHADINHHKFSSCGPIVSNEDVKIAEDGEILVKGPNVMKGYYKNPEATSEVMTEDGYFRTGDIGYISAPNFLHITDRKKDVFKTSSGKYIAPQMIEGKCKESPYISQLCIVGESQKFASAIISPNFEALKIYMEQQGEPNLLPEALVKNEKVIKLIDSEIQKVNKTLGKVEQIAKFRLVTDVWSAESGELTQTQKLKRRVIAQKYETVINEIYGVEQPK
ncbi:MAG: long-chain fatty acid--CoA ligase [Bacteroidales bacterium]|nr:long-chain fatty acid--CoA ligase [Bacteroidales bacterium]